jgi:predicted Zn-dependent peptidase
VNYAPNNLTAALVGDIDPAKATELAKKYFGSLPRGPRPPEMVRTSEMPQLAEKRMIAYAETVPQVRVRYHTVAEGHPDSFVLDILGSVLSGRTGRFYKSLVTQQQVANTVNAFSNGRKYEGLFEIGGVAKPGKTPEEVEQALYKEIDRLRTELVDANELQKVKNQYAAGVFRGIQPNFGLMVQLLLRDNTRGWETINTDPARHQAVTPEDIRRVVNTYFKPENRTIAIYYTKKADPGAKEDPAMAGLSDQEKTQVNGMKAMLATAKPEQIKAFLGRLEQQAASAPPERQNFIKVVRKMLEDRLKELEGGKQ